MTVSVFIVTIVVGLGFVVWMLAICLLPVFYRKRIMSSEWRWSEEYQCLHSPLRVPPKFWDEANLTPDGSTEGVRIAQNPTATWCHLDSQPAEGFEISFADRGVIEFTRRRRNDSDTYSA